MVERGVGMRRMRLLGATAMAVLVAVPTADARAPRPADTVLRNGYVYTVDARDSVRQAVAVRRGKIVYVGSNRGVRRFIGSRTVVRNAGGRMIMPGLHDGHMHPLAGGAGLLKCSLDYQPLTIAEFKTRIAKCLSDTSDDEPDTWLQVINWYQEAMIPAGHQGLQGGSRRAEHQAADRRPVELRPLHGRELARARAREDHRRDPRPRGREDLA